MTKHWLKNAIVVLACAVAVLAQKTDWKEYEYADDGFAISAPSKPSLQSKLMDTPGGRAQVHIYTFADSGDVALVTITDYGTSAKISPQEAFQRAKNTLNGKLLSEKVISLGNNPGIEFEMDSETYHARARYYLVETRLIALVWLSGHGQPVPPDATRMFDSLRLLKPPKQ